MQGISKHSQANLYPSEIVTLGVLFALKGVDILVVRELTGGLYFGWPKGRDVKDRRERAVDTLEYYDYEIKRVMELAFNLAKGRKKKVTSVDKANVLESSRLWRQIAEKIGKENPDIELEHLLVDKVAKYEHWCDYVDVSRAVKLPLDADAPVV